MQGIFPRLLFGISLFTILTWLVIVTLAGGSNGVSALEQPPSQQSLAAASAKTWKEDLDALKQRGVLRVLVPANLGGSFYLPRKGSPVGAQHHIAEAFAASQGLKTQLVNVSRFGDMIPALIAGKGDVIAANLTVTKKRKEQIAFSVPITHSREQILVRAEEEKIKKPHNLKGKKLMVDKQSSFWASANRLAKKHKGLEVLPRPDNIGDEDELDLLVNGEIDAVIRDSNVAQMYLSYRNDIKIAFKVGGVRDIAWGVRKDSPLLRTALNNFLHLQPTLHDSQQFSTGDLDEIRERKVLRVLLRNNAASYFLYRGELVGFEYELAKAFAKSLKLRLEVVVPENHEQLLSWLKEGRGDMATSFLEPLESLRKSGIAFTQPYHFGAQQIVVRAEDKLDKPEDLNGRRITVRKSSAYWESLLALKAQGYNFSLVPAPEDMETEELIAAVANSDLDITVADSHLLDIELAQGLQVKPAFALGDERAHSVAVRPGNPELLKALNSYIKKQYKGKIYNILYKKYFQDRKKIRKLAKGTFDGEKVKNLSPFDKHTKYYSDRYGFDWRLITAQMFQESRFNPKARSFAGAEGLMQVMPKTAEQLGFKNVKHPKSGIHAGVKYMDWVRNRFENKLPFAERLWFTLAAYNAGHGHVYDARRLAKQKGWDPDQWFDNTERAMLLLSKKKYSRKARYGYVRGREPVDYVRNIHQRYRAYTDLNIQ